MFYINNKPGLITIITDELPLPIDTPYSIYVYGYRTTKGWKITEIYMFDELINDEDLWFKCVEYVTMNCI